MAQFPYIYRLDDAPGLSVWHRKKLRRVAETIRRRTGLNYVYNSWNRSILFNHSEVTNMGPIRLDAFYSDGEEKRYSDTEIETAVQCIQLAKRERAWKDEQAQKQEQIEKYEQEKQKQRMFDDRRPDALRTAEYLDRERRGVRKLITA